MNTIEIIALGSLFIALVSLITGFILQRDLKKVRDLERQAEKNQGKLLKALLAIKGYQYIEEDFAKAEGKAVASYRKEVRKDYSQYFNSSFLSPSHIDELIDEIERS